MRRHAALIGTTILAVVIAAISLSALGRGRSPADDGPVEDEQAALTRLPEPQLALIEERVGRGRSTTVVLHPGTGIGAFTIVLERDEGAVVSRASGFQVYPVRDVPVWIAKLGVPNTIPGGRYTLRAVVEYEPDTVELEKPIEVEQVEYRSMEIALDTELTALRRDPDPERTRQAREMMALLSSYRLEGLYYEGSLLIPVEYRRRSAGYGDRRVYRYHDGTRATTVHAGVDLAAPAGEPVYAAGGGRVSFSDDRIISGKSVVIEHLPGVYSVYYHLDEIAVEEGQIVRAGRQIGTVGATGLATGPHLHWELRVGGVPVDPDQFVGAPLVDKVAIFSTIMEILNAPKEIGGSDSNQERG